jgi:membrane-associated phospholipid phosphatase
MLAMVTLLQAALGISDEEAIEYAAFERRWQMLLDGLGEEDAPFSQGCLFNVRQRLVAHDLDRRLLERTVELARRTKAFGVDVQRGKRRAPGRRRPGGSLDPRPVALPRAPVVVGERPQHTGAPMTEHRHRTATRAVAALACALVLAPAPASAEAPPEELTLSYLWDGGALPFVWGSLGASYAIEYWFDPPAQPRLFSPDEGGATSRKDREVPSYVINAGGAVVGVAIAVTDEPSRWYHVKGLVESLLTTSLVTTIGKHTFGRHRPDYDPDTSGDADRKSFPSGHSSGGLAAITYAALYLRVHGFDRFRRPGTLPWWEVATYGGLAALAVAVPYERVLHHRHHATDAISGALIGTASSSLFFLWQERRYRRATRGAPRAESLELAPSLDRPGLMLRGSF